MKMEIIESDLNKLFQWINTATKSLSVLKELCESQQALIETNHEIIKSHEDRISNIEHDLELVLHSYVKHRKDTT
jgi:hypothetical protein